MKARVHSRSFLSSFSRLLAVASDAASPIIYQTTNWRLDNAVEPTHFIKNTFPDPIIPQTVRNALKQTFIML